MKAAYIKFDKYGHEYAYLIPSYLEGDVQAGSKEVFREESAYIQGIPVISGMKII